MGSQELVFLLLTIAIEAPIALLLLYQKESWKRVLLASIFVNMISHPIAWFLVMHGSSWLFVEVLVALLEATLFALVFPRSRQRAAIAAVIMNLVSAAVGLIISSI